MRFFRDRKGCYFNFNQFGEISVRYDANAELYIVKGFFNDYTAPMEITTFKTHQDAQAYLDELMQKYDR